MRARAEATFARTVLASYLGLRAGETATIESWSHALPWARTLVAEVRRIGAEALLVVEDEEAFFRTVADLPRSAMPVSPAALAAIGDVHVYLGGPEALARLRGVGPEEVRALVARHDAAWRESARRARTRFARLAIADATPAAAERFGADLGSWAEELLRAGSVAPTRLAALGRSRSRPLARARRLRVRHANGTDLAVEVVPGHLRIEDGTSARRPPAFATEVPTGRIALLPRPGTAVGRWESNRPLYDRFSDCPVQLGGVFRFVGGRMREFSFDRGGEAFASAYGAGGRGRDLLGAIYLGLNPAIRRAPEVGDLATGAVSLVVGDAPDARRGRGSAFSRTVTLTGAEIELDGRPWPVGGRGTD
ncbi:MAG TPA: hypothetical protein VML94_06640 [Thermoplasmata archaeon]|nr:hypothetical protein [Thermoplasmata archaeon]